MIFSVFYLFMLCKYVFLCFLNNLHPNLKPTYEIVTHELAFQDTQISLSSNNGFSLITNVCRKPTDTKTIHNFHALDLEKWLN